MTGIPNFRLGILDFGYRDIASPTDILNDLIQYAAASDRLGFSNFWFGEHHNGCRAWSNPEMLLPIIAGVSQNISVGMAGVLLAVHSPYRVALNFKILSNLFPGRIDLGLANGAVKPHIVQRLLCNTVSDQSYQNRFDLKVEELLSYFGDENELYQNDKLLIPPVGGLTPRMWKLGISFKGLDYCIEHKMNFCFSLFHGCSLDREDNGKAKMLDFRERFFQRHGQTPGVRIAFSGVCDSSSKMAHKTLENLKINNQAFNDQSIVGDPVYFKEALLALYEKYGVTEFVFYDKTENFKKRMKAIELLAKELF